MSRIVVDFETYYDNQTSVVTQGLRNYVKAADAYIVAVITPEWEFCGPIADLPRLHGDAWMTDPANEFWAANSNFDHAFFKKHYKDTAAPWKCLLDLAAFHQLPRDFAGVARVALGIKMDKSTRAEMKGVRWESLTPERQQQVMTYCLTDARVTLQALEKLPPMTPIEAELAAHTRLINRRGVRVNVEQIQKDCGLLGLLRAHAFEKIPWTEQEGYGRPPLSYPAFSEYCDYCGTPAPASLDKRDLACADWMEANPELAKVVNAMRLFRGVNAKLEKLKSILIAADDGNIIPLDLLYLGARHTRRWSSKNINVQNLDAKRVFAEEMAEMPYYAEHPDERPGIFMREYFLPPPGKKFGIADYSQIEPRCLNWIVGNDEMLDAIRAGYGIYEAHAKATMGWAGNPGTLKSSEPDRYKQAKIRVLALGYGMGWQRYKAKAKTDLGKDLTDKQAVAEVADYRRSNPKIVAQWGKFNQLIRSAAYERDKCLEIEMPTGDKLKHFAVMGKGRGNGFESYTIRGDYSQMSHIHNLFGGLLTENVCQRMGRDILAEAILKLEKDVCPVAFHAHDEAITVLDADGAEKQFEEAKAVMSIPPEWCADLPVEVAGEIHSTYTKLN